MQKQIRKIEGEIVWSGVHKWKSGMGWHWRIKLQSKRVDQVIQIDCYKRARQFASGYRLEAKGWKHYPELRLQQGDRIEVATTGYKKERETNKDGQKYTRHIYSLNDTSEIRVVDRLEACPPPPSFERANETVDLTPPPA